MHGTCAALPRVLGSLFEPVQTHVQTTTRGLSFSLAPLQAKQDVETKQESKALERESGVDGGYESYGVVQPTTITPICRRHSTSAVQPCVQLKICSTMMHVNLSAPPTAPAGTAAAAARPTPHCRQLGLSPPAPLAVPHSGLPRSPGVFRAEVLGLQGLHGLLGVSGQEDDDSCAEHGRLERPFFRAKSLNVQR